MQIKDFLVDKGNHVYYFELTDELLLHTKKPPKGKKLRLFLEVNNTEIELGKIEYIGVL